MKQYTLDDQELKIVISCLDYAKHRLLTAPNAGIHKCLKPNPVIKLRNKLREFQASQFTYHSTWTSSTSLVDEFQTYNFRQSVLRRLSLGNVLLFATMVLLLALALK